MAVMKAVVRRACALTTCSYPHLAGGSGSRERLSQAAAAAGGGWPDKAPKTLHGAPAIGVFRPMSSAGGSPRVAAGHSIEVHSHKSILSCVPVMPRQQRQNSCRVMHGILTSTSDGVRTACCTSGLWLPKAAPVVAPFLTLGRLAGGRSATEATRSLIWTGGEPGQCTDVQGFGAGIR